MSMSETITFVRVAFHFENTEHKFTLKLESKERSKQEKNSTTSIFKYKTELRLH